MKSNKNDFIDAEAIAEAVDRQNLRFVPIKTDGLWQGPLHRHRCIVPEDGFFEWQKPSREAWRFCLSSGKPLGFTGIWDAWKNPDNGAWLQSFAIITVPASKPAFGNT